MPERWQDNPAYAIEPVAEILSDKIGTEGPAPSAMDPVMECCRLFYEAVKAHAVPGSASKEHAMRTIGEWRAAIKAGQGREWAAENHDRFVNAMAGANLTSEGRPEDVLRGAALVAAVGEVFGGASGAPHPLAPSPDSAQASSAKEGEPSQVSMEMAPVRVMGECPLPGSETHRPSPTG